MQVYLSGGKSVDKQVKIIGRGIASVVTYASSSKPRNEGRWLSESRYVWPKNDYNPSRYITRKVVAR